MPQENFYDFAEISRRQVPIAGAVATASTAVTGVAWARMAAGEDKPSSSTHEGRNAMSTITTKDGNEIFHKDWGNKTAQPIVFSHGWPLSAERLSS